MKKNIAIILAVLAFALIGCEQNTPYEPGKPATTDQYVFFPVSAELGLELDPAAGVTSHDFAIERTDATNAQTVKLVVLTNTDNVFKIPESVEFKAGQADTTIHVEFGEMKIGTTYTFSVQVDWSELNPYAITVDGDGKALSPIFTYEVTPIKYEDGVGVWVDDNVVHALYSVDPATAWTVKYQIADMPNGNRKLRIINPYNCMASTQDEHGLFDGCPWQEEGDLIDPNTPSNLMLIINPAKGTVNLENQSNYLGFDWGKGNTFLYDYDNATGEFDAEKGSITFDANDATLVVGRGTSLNAYAGFRFYLTVEAYVADLPEVEELDATVETYEGTWNLSALDLNTNEPVSVEGVTIVSGEDKDGQYYTISGIFEDAPEIYGNFDEKSHGFSIFASIVNEAVIEEVTYQVIVYPVTPEGKLSPSVTLDFEPAEDGSLVLSENTGAVGFILLYQNPDVEDDYKLGDGIYNLKFAPVAASAPAKAKLAPERPSVFSGKKINRHIAVPERVR